METSIKILYSFTLKWTALTLQRQSCEVARLKEELQLRSDQAASAPGEGNQHYFIGKDQVPSSPSKQPQSLPLDASLLLMCTPEQQLSARDRTSASPDASAGPVPETSFISLKLLPVLEAPVSSALLPAVNASSPPPALAASASFSLPADLPPSCQLQAQRGMQKLQSLGVILSSVHDPSTDAPTRSNSEKVCP